MAPNQSLLPLLLIFSLLLPATVRAGEREKPPPIPPDNATGQSSSQKLPEEHPSKKEARPGLGRQIFEDFKNVFTRKENLWIVGAGLGGAWAVSPWDDDIANSSFNSERFDSGTLDSFFEVGETLGGGLVQVGSAAVTFGMGHWLDRPALEDLGRDLVRAQIISQSLTFGVKVATRRYRPDVSNRRSFPSGHVSGTFATATVLQRHYGWHVGIPAYAVASYVAGSRLNESRHYLSDVVFGAAVGIISGRTVTLDIGKRRFLVSPVVVPEGAGLQLSLLP